MHEGGLTIKQAAVATGIPYPNAKSVNRIFQREHRIAKKVSRFRLKILDHGRHILRHKLKIEILNPYQGQPGEEVRHTCGVRRLPRVKQPILNENSA